MYSWIAFNESYRNIGHIADGIKGSESYMN